MIKLDEHSIPAEAVRRIGPAASPRLADLVAAPIGHLHDFARETRLTEAGWMAAIDFLTRTGQTCTDKRQEFIPLSDLLGLSMRVTAQNHRTPPACTEAAVFGPFFLAEAPELPLGAEVAQGAVGEPCFVRGRVLGLPQAGGEPVPVAGARLDVWQADADGFYDVQYAERTAPAARAALRSDAEGGFHFRSIVAEPCPIPHDGPVGELLAALDRHPWRPAHLHFLIQAPGWQGSMTHVLRARDPYLGGDAVFGVRSSLVADWVRHAPGTAPDGTVLSTPFCTLDFDFVLGPA